MSHAFHKTLLTLAASSALVGCGGKLVYGEMEEPTLVFSQPLGQTIPGAPQVPVTVPQSLLTFTFQVPDIPLSGGSTTSKEAGFTIGSTMKLNQAAFIMQQSPNADFNGIDTLTLTISSATQPPKILARYTKDPARLPGQTLVLRPVDDVELLDYLTATGTGSKTITLDVSGSGTLPANSWTADVDLDVRLKVTAGWP
ncbi:MAG TPA: hypothetical protein VEQ15_09220 [Myxococcales bacterium]|jgi:hypothetical protein|nr:hypothetical protein [Myxococcales bacterium]